MAEAALSEFVPSTINPAAILRRFYTLRKAIPQQTLRILKFLDR